MEYKLSVSSTKSLALFSGHEMLYLNPVFSNQYPMNDLRSPSS